MSVHTGEHEDCKSHGRAWTVASFSLLDGTMAEAEDRWETTCRAHTYKHSRFVSAAKLFGAVRAEDTAYCSINN